MSHWPLTDIQVLIAAILGLTLVLLITLPIEKARVTRKEFVRLQEDVKRLSEEVNALQVSVLKLCIAKREAATEHNKMSSPALPHRPEQTGRAREQAVSHS